MSASSEIEGSIFLSFISFFCRMSASSAEERLYWVQCIQDSIREHPFHDIITSKKDALRRHNDPKQQSVRQQHPASLPPSVGTPVKLPRHAALQQAQQGPGTPGTPGKAGGGPRALFKGQMTSTPKTSGTPNENNNSALLGDKLI